MIVSACKYAINSQGETVAFDKSYVEKEFNNSVSKGERVIGIAIKEGNNKAESIFVALLSMKDKIRPNVKNSVFNVISAGIQVVMITGDSKETATAIAAECGIFNPRFDHIVLSADEIHRMTDEQIKRTLFIASR